MSQPDQPTAIVTTPPHTPCSTCFGWHPHEWACADGPYTDVDEHMRKAHALFVPASR